MAQYPDLDIARVLPSRSDPARANIDPWTTCDSASPYCSNASATCRCGFDLPARERELSEAREQSAAPDLWDDPERAQALMRRVARLEAQVESWRSLERRSADLADLAELADETEGEERDALAADIRHDLAELEAQFGEIEVAIMLGGPYDDHDAVIAIHAGAGGTDAQDWTEILL
ncbi:MAG: PCRF domain-containing protein, partial [Chloroflexi bacterium]|nr:PCRF domain-containing protein [Chloroflexota bacterium]